MFLPDFVHCDLMPSNQRMYCLNNIVHCTLMLILCVLKLWIVLGILYKDHGTNKKVHAKIQQAVGPHKDLLTIAMRCKPAVVCPVHQVWTKPSCKAQWKGEKDQADRGRGGKTTSGNGQAWSSPSPRGQWRTGENGGNWLQNHLWCPNDPHG